jgi:hypothetical protein
VATAPDPPAKNLAIRRGGAVMGSFRFAGSIAIYFAALPVSNNTFLDAQPANVAMTSFRHRSEPRPAPSLDLVGMFDQLQPYDAWWKKTAACAGIPEWVIRPDSVRFFFVNAVDFAPVPTDKPDRMMKAVTYARSQQIFISILHVRNEQIVRHEMLHQILFWFNEPQWDDDSRIEFRRCGVHLDGNAPLNSHSR